MFNQYLAERFAFPFNSQIEAINKHHIINALIYLKALSNKHHLHHVTLRLTDSLLTKIFLNGCWLNKLASSKLQ